MIVLVDAYSQIYRCFYAIKALTGANGQPVNALYGIARLLLFMDKTLPSEFGAVVFDKGKACKRTAICPEYKAQRPPMPESMRPQIEPIRQWIRAFGWEIVEQEGLEADDLIAAITRQHGNNKVTIVTSDKDISQLTADADVALALPDKGDTWKVTDAKAVEEKFGVPPQQLRDYLALVGDTSDNIFGVSGIGPKGAVKIINECGGIDALLANPAIDSKLAAKLLPEQERIARNRKLVALDNELPQNWHGLETIARRNPDWELLIKMATDIGFKSLLPILSKRLDEARQPTFF